METAKVQSRSFFNINRVVQYLTFSDIMMLSGWGLVMPILAVFVTEKIPGAGVEEAGIAMTIYFLVRSIAQIPVARHIDSLRGEKDDFKVLITGSTILSLSAFLFIFASEPIHIYLIQIINGFGTALSYPTWLAIFTRHVDKNQEAMEWTMYNTTVDLGTAAAAGIGGFLAGKIGFDYLFLVVGIMSLTGTLFLTGIIRYLKKPRGVAAIVSD
jgi:MFS family permease